MEGPCLGPEATERDLMGPATGDGARGPAANVVSQSRTNSHCSTLPSATCGCALSHQIAVHSGTARPSFLRGRRSVAAGEQSQVIAVQFEPRGEEGS